ncbi:hypothetical protein [Polyangium spumosum]|uniref:Uncharacterized protein n=1 Tax=Polyangium spumosum TaxID=889282 RepID=A0A6N7PV03_9BACT|nr:hypothetical protein [Polyangium spumosum]MRG95888.1 hypothetical protein [Polyangium spumosum]
MRRPRWRPLLSLALLGCLTLSLLPLGCSSATIYRPTVPDDRPRIPESTAERLRECVDELRGTIKPEHYTLDASVKVDQEGRVVEVETTGQPNPDVGICMRIALRGMTLPADVLERRMLRTSASADGRALPDRGAIGEVVTVVVVVTVVFTEVIIEAFAIAVGVTVTATVAAGAAEAFAKRRKRRSCTTHYDMCMDDKTGDEDGNHRGETLCGTCHTMCKNGHWPKQIGTGQSCLYRGHSEWDD